MWFMQFGQELMFKSYWDHNPVLQKYGTINYVQFISVLEIWFDVIF